MIKTSARRFSLALILGATSLLTVGSAHADGTTGTDPCPPGWLCTAGASAAHTTPVSITGTIAQVALVMLGLS